VEQQAAGSVTEPLPDAMSYGISFCNTILSGRASIAVSVPVIVEPIGALLPPNVSGSLMILPVPGRKMLHVFDQRRLAHPTVT